MMKWNACVKSLEFGGGHVLDVSGVAFTWCPVGLCSLVVAGEGFRLMADSATLVRVGSDAVVARGYVEEIRYGSVDEFGVPEKMKGFKRGLMEIELWVEEED